MTASLTLLVGSPCAGKSTYAGRFPGADVVSCDDLSRYVDDGVLLKDLVILVASMRCATGKHTVIDMTCLEPGTRARLRAMAQRHKAPCHAVVFDVPLATLLERNIQRAYPHPPAVILACYRKAQRAVRDVPGEGFTSVRIERAALAAT